MSAEQWVIAALVIGIILMSLFIVALWAARRVGYQEGVENTLEAADKRTQGAYQIGISDGVAQEKKRVADLKSIKREVPKGECGK